MNEYLIMKYESRINELMGRGDKNTKSGGVVRKLKRKLMKMKENENA